MSADTLYVHRVSTSLRARQLEQKGRGRLRSALQTTGTSEGGVPGLACVPRSMLCSTGEEGTGSVLFRVDTTCQLVFGEGGGMSATGKCFLFPV